MIKIPSQLIQALAPVGTQRFILLPTRKKHPPPEGWAEPENQYTPDNPELAAHLKAGGNYGVVFGRGVVGLDTDAPETEAIAKTFPPTFTVRSGGEGDRFHRYYRSDLEKTLPLRKSPTPGAKKIGYGEVRASRAYLVGPGSIHPDTGREYVVSDPRPMAFMSKDQLREAFKDYMEPDPENGPAPRPTGRTTSEVDNLKIEDVINAYGINLKKTGGELRGVNPTHGDNPSSFAVNLEKNTWRCHACQSGGGPIELVAIMENIISCEQAVPGALRGDLFKEVLVKAREKRLIKEVNPAAPISQTPPVPQLLLPGYRVAQAGDRWVIIEIGKKEKPRLTFEAIGSVTAKKIADTLEIEVETAERQLAALAIYLETKNALKAQQEAAAVEKRNQEIAAGGYDHYLDFNEWGHPIWFHSEIMVEDLIKEYDLITFTDTEDTWVYDANAKIYRDTGIAAIKQFILKALGEFFRTAYCEETIYQVKIATYVTREDVEPPAELLNLRNGVLNVRTRELAPHTPKPFFINCSPTDYDPSAPRPYFDAMIKDFKCIKIDAVQEFTGDLLLDSPKYKKALLLNGPTDSGKTTFTNAIVNVIGKDSICSIPVQHLDHRFQSQRLYKTKLNLCGDLGAEAFRSIGMFNRTVGGDLIEAEVKGINKRLKFIWGGKHWYDVNDIPKAEGSADSDAYFNRLLMATLSIQIPKDQQDKNLPEKLKLETSGILNWMLEGLDRLEKNGGFSDTTSIEEIKDHYKRGSDNIYCFTQDRCRVVKGEFTPKLMSHNKYVKYCIEKGFSPKGRGTFYEALQINLPAIKPDRRKVGSETPQVWLNLKIFDEDINNEDENPTPPEADGAGEPTNLTSFTSSTAHTPPPPETLPPAPSAAAGASPAKPGLSQKLVKLVKLVDDPAPSVSLEPREVAPEPVEVDPTPPPPGDPGVRLCRLATGFMERQPNGSSPRQLFFNYMLEAGYGEEEVISTLANVEGWAFNLIFVQFHPRGVAP